MSGESEAALASLRRRLDEAEELHAELVDRARRHAEERVDLLARSVEEAERTLAALRDRVEWASDLEALGGSSQAPRERQAAPATSPGARHARGRAMRRVLLAVALAALALCAALALGWRPELAWP